MIVRIKKRFICVVFCIFKINDEFLIALVNQNTGLYNLETCIDREVREPTGINNRLDNICL